MSLTSPKAEVQEGAGDDLANGGFDEWDSCGGKLLTFSYQTLHH